MRITDKINLARIVDKLRRYHGETSTRETFGVASGTCALPVRTVRALAATLAAVTLLALANSADARSLALVIGNNDYENVAPLQTAVNDARAVGDELETMGFVVRRAFNVDKRAMSRVLAAFDSELKPGDRALLFYAGHGFEVSGANYVLPVDVPAAQSSQIDLALNAAFSVEKLIDGIRAHTSGLTIVVLDACRDNPFASGGVRAAAATAAPAHIDVPDGVFVLMSADARQEALDRLWNDDGEVNSVFTRTFLSELARPNRTLVQIAKATQVGVQDLAASIGRKQTPAYYDKVVGDVVLSDVAKDATASSANRAEAIMTRATTIPAQENTGDAHANAGSFSEAILDEGSDCNAPTSSPKIAMAISCRLNHTGLAFSGVENAHLFAIDSPRMQSICLEISWLNGS
jgi:hypothetical protein